MANPAVTYTFANSTTADASQVNTNFQDIIDSLTDGTKSLTIDALTCAGSATFNGAVTLGNGTPDDITWTGSLASTIPIKTTYSYDFGSSTIGLRSVYLGSSDSAARTTRIIGATVASSWTFTLPTAVPSAAKSVMTFDTSGTASFEHRSIATTVSKTNSDSPYTVLATDQVILCNATSGAITVNLPAAASYSGKVLIVKKTDSSFNAVTLDGNSTETIDGSETTTLNTQYESVTIVCDGSNWHVLDRKTSTPWTSYTPTFTSLGTCTSVSFWWKRQGDTIYVMGKATTGTTTAGAVGVTIPSGLSIDTDKAPSGNFLVGSTTVAYSNTAGQRNAASVAWDSSNTRFTFTNFGDGGSSNNLTSNGASTFLSTSVAFSFFAQLPISGWKT